MSRVRKPVHIEPKGWGREVWIANNDRYRGKILEIRQGKRCSPHYRKLETETFYLRTGKLKVRVKETDAAETLEEFILGPGIAWMCRPDWSIRWKPWKTRSCSSFPLGTSRPTLIGWSREIKAERN
jgi:hypothetical protein